MTRGEIWWADLGPYRSQQQTGRRPVIVWQSDRLTRLLQSVLVVPLTTNLERARLAGTALIGVEGGLSEESVALAFQMRAIPKSSLKVLIRVKRLVVPGPHRRPSNYRPAQHPMEPARPLSDAIMSLRRAAHLAR